MLRVVFCDDEGNYQSKFLSNHDSLGIEVIPHQDVHTLPSFLLSMQNKPDLVVLDLYHTKESPGSDIARDINEEVEKKVQVVKQALEALAEVVTAGKEPAALEALEEIRANPSLHDLPVLLYTRQGLALLDDAQLLKAIHLDAEWMIKGRSKEFELGRMLSYVERHRRSHKRLKRDLILTIIGTLLGVGLAILWDLAKGHLR